MDFHGMIGIGEMLRKTGAFFMRRSFGSDEFYWRIFTDYMHEVMTFNDFGLEFFVEGTRSRSHKALTPKTGLLSMALEPYFMSELYDIMIVPVSISYEKPMEEQLFVYELLGIPKPKESTIGLIKGIGNIKNSNLGKIYFDFCEPITLNEYFGNNSGKFNHAIEPACVQKLNGNDYQNISNLANQVVKEQQKKIVMFSYNLISLAYNESIFIGEKNEFSLENLKKKLVEYTEIFEIFGAIVDIDLQNLDQCIKRTFNIHSNILKIDQQSQVNLIKSNINLVNINPSKLKGIRLANEIMNVAVPTFSLQLYCNPTLFWLSQPSFIILSLMNEISLEKHELRKKFEFLRKIFIYEFVLYPQFGDQDFENAINGLKKIGLIECHNDSSLSLINDKKSINLMLSAVAPFLNSYLNTSKVILTNFSKQEFVEKDVFKGVQTYVENSILKGHDDVHPYTLCLDTITMIILSLCNNNCLIKRKQLSLTLIFKKLAIFLIIFHFIHSNSINHFTVHQPELSSFTDELHLINSKLPFQFKYFETLIKSKY
jgi:glyceronephosphate O-acyltransferase